MNRAQPYKIYYKPTFKSPSLIVTWSQDAGRLSSKVFGVLNSKLKAREFCELDPPIFFSLWGVQIEDNVIQFPESKFYSCEEKDLLLFKSDSPVQEWYKFLNTILDVAKNYCNIKEVYTLGGFISSMAHTSYRRIIGVVNQPELKKKLFGYVSDIDNMEYETPAGGRPTLNSYLLWVAKRRNIDCINLWVEVPFYLAALEDPRACKNILSLFDSKFGLNMDLEELEKEIKSQNEKIEQLRTQNPDISRYIEMMERGIMLNQEESEKLVQEVSKYLI